MKKRKKTAATKKPASSAVQVVAISAKGKGVWTYKVNQVPTYPTNPHSWSKKSAPPARQKYNEVF